MLERPGRAGTYPFPVKYAYQLVGRVIETGVESGFEVGDRVFVQHPHQDVFTIPVRGRLPGAVLPLESVFPVDAGLSAERAVMAHLYSVALNTLLDAPVRFGESVAVSGLGIIGIFVAHMARMTAGRVVLIEPNPWRRKLAAFLGADAVVAPDEAEDAIREVTGGRGVDLHFEVSGAPAALRSALGGLAREGTAVVASNFGSKPVELFLARVSQQAAQDRLEPGRQHQRRALAALGSPARMATAIEHLLRHDFSFLITDRVPLAAAATAYRTLDTADSQALGVLLTYPPA